MKKKKDNKVRIFPEMQWDFYLPNYIFPIMLRIPGISEIFAIAVNVIIFPIISF